MSHHQVGEKVGVRPHQAGPTFRLRGRCHRAGWSTTAGVAAISKRWVSSHSQWGEPLPFFHEGKILEWLYFYSRMKVHDGNSWVNSSLRYMNKEGRVGFTRPWEKYQALRRSKFTSQLNVRHGVFCFMEEYISLNKLVVSSLKRI